MVIVLKSSIMLLSYLLLIVRLSYLRHLANGVYNLEAPLTINVLNQGRCRSMYDLSLLKAKALQSLYCQFLLFTTVVLKRTDSHIGYLTRT